MPQGHGRHRSRAAIVIASLLVLFVLAWPSFASAAESKTPGLEVAPGVYLAAASDLPTSAAEHPHASERGATPSRFIVGGKPSTIERWPWLVSVNWVKYVHDNDWKSHNCGGTLVAPTIVVTAAHCVTLGPNLDFKPPSDFRVISGRTKLSTTSGQVHGLDDYYYFVDANGKPLWNPQTLSWDVVFLHLATPSAQQTIKIAGAGEATNWLPGYRAWIAGWGVTSEGADRGPDVLRQAPIRMVSDSKCDSVWGPLFVPTVMVSPAIWPAASTRARATVAGLWASRSPGAATDWSAT